MIGSLPMIADADLACDSSRGGRDESGFGGLRTERGHLPLEAMDVRGRIDGLLARVIVRQTFVNAFEEPLEASYIFPLPDRAAVTRFRMMVAGREIDGVLEERGKAREHYDEAIAEGRRASIAEEDRPGVFNLRVGNLMPGERATVELTLCGVLPYADGEATFRFPLVVAPRYIPGRPLPGPSVGDGTAVDTVAVPDASRISPPVLLPGFPNPVRLGIEVELHDGGAEADGVRSSLHAVEEQARDGYRRIRIQPGERLDRDFILRFRLGGAEIRSALTLHPDADDRAEGTFALTIVPPSSMSGMARRPRDVVFLLDRSGSMEGWKMVAARRTVSRMIDSLDDADRFAVLPFDSSVETPDVLPEGLAPAGDRNRFRAVEYLAGIEARGGTMMAEPLDRGVKLLSAAKSGDRDCILVLITDGQVGNEDQILSTLGKRLDRIRVFTVGIDRAVNEGFLRRLAERGGGACELVESEDRLDDVMAAIRRRIGTPILSGLALDSVEPAIEPGEVVPRRIPDLFPGSPLLILGRYQGNPRGAIALRATAADGSSYSESVTAIVRDNPAIAAAWSRGQIRQLEDRYAAGDGDRDALEKAIVGISLKFGVLCRFTAYVAIDRSEVVNKGGSVHRTTQPVEMPSGWAGASPQSKLDRVRRPRVQIGYGADDVSSACFAAMPAPPARMRAMPPASPPPPSSIEDTGLEFMCFDAEMALPSSSRTLADWLRTDGPMPPRDAARVVAELAERLQKIHDDGQFHRSITTESVLIDDGLHPSFADDFVTAADHVDCASDVQELGAILYEMITGFSPILSAAQSGLDTPTPPRGIIRTIPAKLEAICLKAMAKDPTSRYATAGELAQALRQFLEPRRKPFWK